MVLEKFLCSYFWTFIVFFPNLIDGQIAFSTGHPFFDPETEPAHAHDKSTADRMAVSFPGTKWCGPGNTAAGYDDLGKYEDTDKCCRDHDHCENIPAGEEKHGLRNDDWFTRLHCDCDKNFYQCLHANNSTVSDVVGTQYFLARDRCFKEEYEIVECIEYQSNILIRRCIKYKFDNTKPKKYQWFDLPLYNIRSFPDLHNENYYQRQHELDKNILITYHDAL